MIARRNLANRVRSEIALKNREVRYAHDLILPRELHMRRTDIDLWDAVSAVTIRSSERRATELWLDGEGNDAIAQALGVKHLDREHRRREVKRFKDRLLKRLSRHLRADPGRE
jgi:hypothetical protein